MPVERSDGTAESEERRSAQLKARRLEEELQDLREAYARKIANVELKCERLLREKDDASSAWYKERKQEILKMQAAVTIMKALFDKKRDQFAAEMKADKAEFERQQEAFRAETTRMKSEHADALFRFTKEIKEKSDVYELQIRDLTKEKNEREETNKRLEEQLSQARAANAKLTEANEALRRETETLRRRLIENECTEELARKNSQIEALEQELKKTRKMMLDKRHAEAEALRKELMDYVAFIVRILPDDWRSFEGLPKEVKERLKWPAAGAPCPAPGDVNDRFQPHAPVPLWSTPRSPKGLPPVSVGATASPGRWRPRTPDTARVRF